MALKKKPVTGMRDILPAEMQVREYVMNQIRETYRSFGFTQVETPCVEHIENLTSKQGGEIENAAPKKAYLIEKGMDPARYGQIMKQAMGERKAGVQVLVSMMNKNKKFQKEQLNKEGYTEFVEFYKEALK